MKTKLENKYRTYYLFFYLFKKDCSVFGKFRFYFKNKFLAGMGF